MLDFVCQAQEKGIVPVDDQLLEQLNNDENVAKCYFLKLRWPNYQRTCPRCGSREFSWRRSGTKRACGRCRFEYGEFTGTWLGGSKLEFTYWTKIIDGFVRGLTPQGMHIKYGIRQPTAWSCMRTIRLAIEADALRPVTLDEIKLLEAGDAAKRSTYDEFQKSLAKHHGVKEAAWPLYYHEFEFRKKTGDADMFEEVVKLLVRLKVSMPNPGSGKAKKTKRL